MWRWRVPEIRVCNEEEDGERGNGPKQISIAGAICITTRAELNQWVLDADVDCGGGGGVQIKDQLRFVVEVAFATCYSAICVLLFVHYILMGVIIRCH